MKGFDDQALKLIKGLVPPLFLSVILRVRSRFQRRDFMPWWRAFRTTQTLPQQLVDMVDYFVQTEDYRKLSEYWHWLNKKNIEQIASEGLGNYRQTVAKNYFTWVGQSLDNSYTRNLISQAQSAKSKASLSELFRRHDLFSLDESVQHNLVTVLLHEYVIASGLSSPLSALDESGMGNPPCIEIDGKRISQDMLNSAIEFRSVQDGQALGSSPVIMEVGAGSGRTAYCFLKLIPQAKYIIVDVPPALFISQHFLSSQFKDKKVFAFRPFNAYSDIAKEFEASDIAFLMPHQLKLVGRASIDVFLAIDCLHEMTPNQVEFYFSEADRLARNIYFKCWLDTKVPFDGITWSSDSYPVRPGWGKKYWRKCAVPADFFEAYFHIRP